MTKLRISEKSKNNIRKNRYNMVESIMSEYKRTDDELIEGFQMVLANASFGREYEYYKPIDFAYDKIMSCNKLTFRIQGLENYGKIVVMIADPVISINVERAPTYEITNITKHFKDLQTSLEQLRRTGVGSEDSICIRGNMSYIMEELMYDMAEWNREADITHHFDYGVLIESSKNHYRNEYNKNATAILDYKELRWHVAQVGEGKWSAMCIGNDYVCTQSFELKETAPNSWVCTNKSFAGGIVEEALYLIISCFNVYGAPEL